MLKSFIAKNYKKFYFALCINIVFYIIFNLLFYARYNAVDDPFMEMFVCGAYGDFDPHMIYSNIVFGFILSNLYRITTAVPWYGIFQILLALFSLSTILYVFFNRENKHIKILALAADFATAYEAFTKVQFTKTAAYLAIAGYLLVAYSFETKNRKKTQIYGIIFIALSFMTRIGMFLGTSSICVGCFILLILKSLKNIKSETDRHNLLSLVGVGCISLLLVGSLYFIDSLAYRSPGWVYYKNFNEYTTQFEDINFPSYDLYEEEYNELGINREDYLLYANVDHNDPDVFSMEVMEKVKQFQPHKHMDSNEFVMFLLRGKNALFKHKPTSMFTFLIVSILLLYVFAGKPQLSRWLAVCFIGILAFANLFYSYMMHEWLDRVTISVLVAVIFSLFYVTDLKDNQFIKYLTVFVACAVLIISCFAWKGYVKGNMQGWIDEYNINHEVLDEIYEDKEHLYMSRTLLPLWKIYYTPYSGIRKGAMGNYSMLGDWIANTPLYVDVINKYGISNPYRDLINNNQAYFIGYQEDMDLVLAYLQRHYDPNAQAHLVRNSGPYYIYSIVSKK